MEGPSRQCQAFDVRQTKRKTFDVSDLQKMGKHVDVLGHLVGVI